MQLLVIDESEKKALRRSRRVLATYLFRRGSRTFTGRLSREGVTDLLAALRRVASKATSVVVYQLTAHSEFELVARIGNTRAWGEEGWYSHRASRSAGKAQSFSPVERLIRSLTRLAALLHDIGKANLQFQAMLRGKSGAQVIRHDLLSYLLLKQLGANGRDLNTSLLHGLANEPALLFELISAHLPGALNSNPIAAKVVASPTDSEALEALASDVLLSLAGDTGEDRLVSTLEYLVLTHHRLIDTNNYGQDDHHVCARAVADTTCVPSALVFTNPYCEWNPLNTKLPEKGLPWQDARWLASVQQIAKVILRLLQDNPDLLGYLDSHPLEWAKAIGVFARPALIQADHLASALKEPTALAPERLTDTLFANTDSDGNLCDTLSTHLLKARRAVDPLYKGMCDMAPMPRWAPSPDSPLFQRSDDSRFKWQSDVADLISESSSLGENPLFALVVSSTGAGKTIAAPKILAAANKGAPLRISVALGLRALSLQTGEAYKTRLGVTSSDALTVVGDSLYAELMADQKARPLDQQGSESLEEGGDLMLDWDAPSSVLGEALGLDEAATKALSGKAAALNAIPVLVCTVDHLMGAASLGGGHDMRQVLRLATSDLILDEIDGYGLEDLQALGRLVHTAGCYGRKVVLMSATVGEEILVGLHSAWKAGLAVWEFRTGRKTNPHVALVSNQVPSKLLDSGVDVPAAINSFMSDICAQLRVLKPKVLAQIIPLDPSDTVEDAYAKIYQTALGYAKVHYTEHEGQRISTGFVRFNAVEHARAFAQFAASQPSTEELDVKVVCYHSRFPLYDLTRLEKGLGRLMARHNPNAIFDDPLVKEWLTEKPHRVILVSTTSIQETGRDHDYDFAVGEPWSMRSFVQLVGRVLRHRQLWPSSPNVGILSRELNQLKGEAPSRALLEVGCEPRWARNDKAASYAVLTTPGAAKQDRARAAFKAQHPLCGELEADRSKAYPETFFTHGVTAEPCLKSAIDPKGGWLSYLEHLVQRTRMSTEEPGLFTLSDYVQPDYDEGLVAVTWGRHNAAIQFRRAHGARALFTLDPAPFKGLPHREVVALQKNPVTYALAKVPLAVPASKPPVNESRFLVPLPRPMQDEWDKLNPSGTRQWMLFSFEVTHYEKVAGHADEFASSNSLLLDYHPLLGANLAKKSKAER